jgi:hypothetical protein
VDVGRRAGFAIDHALLYRAAEETSRLRENLARASTSRSPAPRPPET